MPTWLEEFLIVTDASRRVQIRLLAIPLVPSIVLLLGVFNTHGAESAGQYSSLDASLREGALYFYLTAAASTCIACIRIAAKEYRCVHKRLFDY